MQIVLRRILKPSSRWPLTRDCPMSDLQFRFSSLAGTALSGARVSHAIRNHQSRELAVGKRPKSNGCLALSTGCAYPKLDDHSRKRPAAERSSDPTCETTSLLPNTQCVLDDCKILLGRSGERASPNEAGQRRSRFRGRTACFAACSDSCWNEASVVSGEPRKVAVCLVTVRCTS